MIESVLLWFYNLIFGNLDFSSVEGIEMFVVPFLMIVSSVAILLCMSFVFKFILKLVDR